LHKIGRSVEAFFMPHQPVHQPFEQQQAASGKVALIVAPRLVGGEAGGDLIGERVGIAGAAHGLGRGEAHRDMVGMPVPPIGTEGQYDIRPERAYDSHDIAHKHVLVKLTERAVAVVPADGVARAEALGGQVQLLLAHRSQRAAGGDRGVADLPRLALRRGHDHDLRALCRVFSERAAGDEDLVVGMGEYSQDARARPCALVPVHRGSSSSGPIVDEALGKVHEAVDIGEV